MELYMPLPGLNFDFQTRKWNYPNRKWNYISHFQASDQKTSFTKCFSFVPRGSKSSFQTGNGIIKTGNGIISPTSRPRIKKTLLKRYLIWSKEFKINFQNRKWNYPDRKWNYFTHFQAYDQKTVSQNIAYLSQRVHN